MKKRAVFVVVALSLSFSTGLLVGESSRKNPANNQAMSVDPAFRDGLYQAKMDVRDGRKPHLSVGRWSSESARASYVAGYREGYRESIGSPSGSLSESSVAQLAASGFRDGLADGAWHRLAAEPFQGDQTPHYREAGIGELEVAANADAIKHFYREAYLHGYQQAYYSSSK
jgi:hypothetical protein